jgi:acyl-[acyl-carrier-protein]-phospholipid O-acyltransferase/long-chain-fatty-acid--[acyl-carrier-protein] ligase
MVPRQHIEEKLQALLGKEETVCAVTSAPDEKKGEQLVVLLTPEAGDPAEAHRLLAESNLPRLWVPAKKNFFTIDAIPILGTGKVDLKGLSTLGREKIGAREA